MINIERIESDLSELAQVGSRKWAYGAFLLTRYCELDRSDDLTNIGAFITRVSAASGIRTGELWRWLRAGQFYLELRKRHWDLPHLTESAFGLVSLEALSSIYRLAPVAEIDRLLADLTAGRLTQSRLRQICNLYRGATNRPRKRRGKFADNGNSDIEYRDAREEFGGWVLVALAEQACQLPLLPSLAAPQMFEMVSFPALSGLRQPGCAMMTFDAEQAASIHVFKPEFHAGGLVAGRYEEFSRLWSDICDYFWVVIRDQPSPAMISKARRVGCGILFTLRGRLTVGLAANKQSGGKTADTILRMATERLLGQTTWVTKCTGKTARGDDTRSPFNLLGRNYIPLAQDPNKP